MAMNRFERLSSSKGTHDPTAGIAIRNVMGMESPSYEFPKLTTVFDPHANALDIVNNAIYELKMQRAAARETGEGISHEQFTNELEHLRSMRKSIQEGIV